MKIVLSLIFFVIGLATGILGGTFGVHFFYLIPQTDELKTQNTVLSQTITELEAKVEEANNKIAIFQKHADPKPPVDARYLGGVITNVSSGQRKITIEASMLRGETKAYTIYVPNHVPIVWREENTQRNNTDDIFFLDDGPAYQNGTFQNLAVGKRVLISTEENVMAVNDVTAKRITIQRL